MVLVSAYIDVNLWSFPARGHAHNFVAVNDATAPSSGLQTQFYFQREGQQLACPTIPFFCFYDPAEPWAVLVQQQFCLTEYFFMLNCKALQLMAKCNNSSTLGEQPPFNKCEAIADNKMYLR